MERTPIIVAISGVKNSGKTTLIEKLIPILQAKGQRVAVIKHDGHSFSPDTPGTDSRRFWDQGAAATAVFDGEKASVTCRGTIDATQLIAAFSPLADVILLEGFKSSAYPKIELLRSETSLSPACDPETCIAYVSDVPLQIGKPCFSFGQATELADLILSIP